MTIQQQAHRELVAAVSAAYGLSLAEVNAWPSSVVRVMHRKAIDLGLINQPQPCEALDDTEVLPF